jgi:hypothetical protein
MRSRSTTSGSFLATCDVDGVDVFTQDPDEKQLDRRKEEERR